jgi:sterol desaturase/sphingolipid hydroxylase (fatty acid hydroxylase superfamily)
MFWLRVVLSATGFLEPFICSCLLAEFVGYWLHRLLHSDKLSFLSRNHMAHHLLLYGPTQPMRAKTYKDATHERFSLGNVGLEWLIPSAVVLLSCWGLMCMFHVRLIYQVIALGNLVVWPFLTFSFLHDAMHVRDPWIARVPVVNVWFRRARRLHDIHHHSLSHAGRMNANFGIGFFFFDRIFHTLAPRHSPLNREGLAIALQRYKLATPLPPADGDRSGDGEVAFQ